MPQRLSSLVALAVMATLSQPAMGRAQVIEIGESGAVSVYDRPTVFTADGARPIVPPPRPGSAAPADTGRAAVRREISAAASDYGLSPALVEAVAWRESGLRQSAGSAKGAVGVMQLMPATAAGLGVDPHDRGQNIRGGTAYLRQMIDRFGGDLALGLAAYNAGPGAVRRFGRTPPYGETQAYISAILERLAQQAPQP